MLRFCAVSTEGADLRSGTPPDEEASLHNHVTFHRGSNTGATQFAALLVANLRPPPATWPQASDSEIGGGCAWLRYLHIVHKEWLKIAIEAKLHVFHLGKGDFCLAGGIPGTGSEVVPPLGSEMAQEPPRAAFLGAWINPCEVTLLAPLLEPQELSFWAPGAI